jgi:hypothetical protein
MSDDSPPNDWPGYYRGYTLRANPDREVWWQVYNGTERLHLDPVPEQAVERLTALKSLGGRMHVTEEGDVLTRVEQDDGSYREVWLDQIDLDGQLRPAEAPEETIPVRPSGLSPGDLWPSVYDGARFSFVERDRVWWKNPDTHRRHYIEDPLPEDVALELKRYKSKGGSFRVTPWKDVLTLIPFHPRPDVVEEQFQDLSPVIRNIIKLRKERGVEMLPIYLGNVEGYTFEIQEAQNLSDPLSEEEAEELESWARNLGRTNPTSADNHRSEDSDTADPDPDDEVAFDDDPEDWDDDTDSE